MKKIIVACGVGVGFYILAYSFFQPQQTMLIAIIAFLITLWTNEALPLGVVSLLPIVLFPAFGILETKVTTANYSHPIIYLFLGGFLLAVGVQKSKLHIYIAHKILSFFPATPRGMIFSLALTSAILSSVLSNTTTTLLLISIALYLTQERSLKLRFALAIAYGASIGGILTPIGTPPNLILLGVMEENGMEPIAFFKWMMLVAPLVFVMLGGVSLVLSFGLEKKTLSTQHAAGVLDCKQKKMLFILAAVVGVLLLNAPIKPYWDGLGMSESVILLSFGLMLFFPKVDLLEWNEDITKIPFAIMFLFGAGFSIAKAFGETGLADSVAAYLLEVTTLSPFMLLVVVAVMITFTTEVTSNTALISIMLPVIYSVAQQSGIDTTLFMMVATVCASYAFMLPIATAPNAIAMSTKAVQVKDMMKFGIVLNILGVGFIVVFAHYYWSYFL